MTAAPTKTPTEQQLLEALKGLLMYPLGTFQVAAAKAAIEATEGKPE